MLIRIEGTVLSGMICNDILTSLFQDMNTKQIIHSDLDIEHSSTNDSSIISLMNNTVSML
jgi:hypothetical protein